VCGGYLGRTFKLIKGGRAKGNIYKISISDLGKRDPNCRQKPNQCGRRMQQTGIKGAKELKGGEGKNKPKVNNGGRKGQLAGAGPGTDGAEGIAVIQKGLVISDQGLGRQFISF